MRTSSKRYTFIHRVNRLPRTQRQVDATQARITHQYGAEDSAGGLSDTLQLASEFVRTVGSREGRVASVASSHYRIGTPRVPLRRARAFRCEWRSTSLRGQVGQRYCRDTSPVSITEGTIGAPAALVRRWAGMWQTACSLHPTPARIPLSSRKQRRTEVEHSAHPPDPETRATRSALPASRAGHVGGPFAARADSGARHGYRARRWIRRSHHGAPA